MLCTVCALLPLVMGALACGASESSGTAGAPAGSRQLQELERLAFVPAGSSRLEGYVGPYAECAADVAIVVDRFEFTRGDWLHYDPTGARASAAAFTKALGQAGAELFVLGDETRDLPAYLSFDEAQSLAEARGMRLPTPREWVYVAVGGRSLFYPYGGRQPQKSWANTLELGLSAPTPVGTFESGRSRSFDCYDLLGNVWEWVDGAVLGYGDFPGLGAWDELEDDRLASAMGGGFDSRSRRTFGRAPLRLHAMLLDQGTVRPSIGARMCADADGYLRQQAERWGRDDVARVRVRAVGERWAATLGKELVVPFLEELAQQGPTPITWLAEGARGDVERSG